MLILHLKTVYSLLLLLLFATLAYGADPCLLPNYEHLTYTQEIGTEKTPLKGNTITDYSPVRLKCDRGYVFETSRDIPDYVTDCQHTPGFLPPIERCLRKCEKLREMVPNSEILCYENKTQVNCRNVLLAGATVRIRCKNLYRPERQAQYREIKCKENGRWELPNFKCIPECGKLSPELQKPNQQLLDIPHFPWSAGLYYVPKRELVGLGTLISDRAVITSHNSDHDFDRGDTNYGVMLGNTLGIYSRFHSANLKVYKVKWIRKYKANLALLYMENHLVVSNIALPICLELHKSKSELKAGSTGVVSFFNSSATVDNNIRVLNLNATYKAYVITEYGDSTLTIKFNQLRNYDYAYEGEVFFTLHSDKKYYLHGLDSRSGNGVLEGTADFDDFLSYSSWIRDTISNETKYELIGKISGADCGTVFANIEPKIVKGVEEKFGNAPWHVGLYDMRHKPPLLVCGGTIISPRIIISAAHCFLPASDSDKFNVSNYEITVAKVSRSYNTTDNQYQKMFKIKDVKYPDEYHAIATSYASDIVLIILYESIEFSNVVKPACIRLSNEDPFRLVNGLLGKISGWGADGNAKLSEILLTVNATVIDHKNCAEKIKREEWSAISNDKFCAGGIDGSNVIGQGDSGGGILFPDQETFQFYLQGIVSYKFIANDKFALFTDIKYHTEWIREKLREIS